MESLPKSILSSELKESDIPRRFKNWSSVIEFAATFDPRQEPVSVKGLDSVQSTSTIAERRAALFFEYRRYNHLGHPPSNDIENSCIAIIESIRTEIRNKK